MPGTKRLRPVYVSVQKRVAEVLVNNATSYSVPTLAATYICKHFNIDYKPRKNARKLWKLSPDELKQTREKNKFYDRTKRAKRKKLSEMSEFELNEYRYNKDKDRRERKIANGDEVWDLIIDKVHYCNISHPKEWDDLPTEERERLLRNLYTRRRQKRVRERIKAVRAEEKARKEEARQVIERKNYRKVGMEADKSCLECKHYEGGRCMMWLEDANPAFVCDSFDEMW